MRADRGRYRKVSKGVLSLKVCRSGGDAHYSFDGGYWKLSSATYMWVDICWNVSRIRTTIPLIWGLFPAGVRGLLFRGEICRFIS